MNKAVTAILCGFLLTASYGCNYGIHVLAQKQYAPIGDHEGFVLFDEKDTTDLKSKEVVGEIEIKRGMKAGCSYQAVIEFAKGEAKNMGANALKIHETRPPDIWVGPCYKIKAIAYRLEDVYNYEREIIWHKDRKLVIRDFKGSTEERPFLAVTSTQIRLNYVQFPGEKYATCSTETWFSCGNSYFTDHADSVATLEHEQLHFDIAELHARKLVKQIAEEVKDVSDLQIRGQQLLNNISSMMYLAQDKYDSEVYIDPGKQAIWNKKIKDELDALKAYEIKKVKIKIKA